MLNTIRKILSRKGLTLTELLVASVLMGIVMVGIAGFSVAIKRMQDTTDKQAILTFHVTGAMAFIERGVSQTFGSRAVDLGYTNGTGTNSPPQGTGGNPPDCDRATATFCYDDANPKTYWSFRIDPNNTPMDYTDDSWFILFSRNTGADKNSLNGCIQPDGTSPGEGPDPDEGQTPCGQNRFSLLYRSLDQSASPSISIVWVENNSPSGLALYVEVTINTLYDGAGTYDPLTNPRYSMTTRIPLTQYSTDLL